MTSREEFEQSYRNRRKESRFHSVAAGISDAMIDVMLKAAVENPRGMVPAILFLLEEFFRCKSIENCDAANTLYADESNTFMLLADFLSHPPMTEEVMGR